MGRDVGVGLAESLAENNTLKRLCIKHPSIGIDTEGASALVQMIKNNHHLQELIVIDDTVNENVASQLRESGHQLRVLKLES